MQDCRYPHGFLKSHFTNGAVINGATGVTMSMASMKTRYPLLMLVYVLAWALQFSRLEGGAYSTIGLLAALSYGAGQTYEWRFRGHLGLSADPVAMTLATVTIAITTFAFVALGRLPSAIMTYFDIVARFFTALLVGHVAGFSSAFVMSKLMPARSDNRAAPRA